MAYVKFVLLSVFFLATFATFPIPKVEADCGGVCVGACGLDCVCFFVPLSELGNCVPGSYKDAVKIFGENLVCQNDAECKNKGSDEKFCVRSPNNPDLKYGFCTESIFEEDEVIFKIISSKSKFIKDLLKMPTMTA